MNEDEWYQSLRRQWKPDKIRLLLIGESAPLSPPDIALRRFFFAPTLTRSDNLFRGVVAALYDSPSLTTGQSKEQWLQRLKADGVFLIDLVTFPVNHLTASQKKAQHRANAERCVAAAKELEPAGVIVCHKPSFNVLRDPLVAADLPLLHDEAIPFPLGNFRAKFIDDVRAALQCEQAGANRLGLPR